MTNEINTKYAEKCWDIANGICGFSALQSLAASLASQTEYMKPILMGGAGVAAFLSFLATVIYTAALWMLFEFQKELLAMKDKPLLRICERVTIGRLIAVWLSFLIYIISIGRFLP